MLPDLLSCFRICRRVSVFHVAFPNLRFSFFEFAAVIVVLLSCFVSAVAFPNFPSCFPNPLSCFGFAVVFFFLFFFLLFCRVSKHVTVLTVLLSCFYGFRDRSCIFGVFQTLCVCFCLFVVVFLQPTFGFAVVSFVLFSWFRFCRVFSVVSFLFSHALLRFGSRYVNVLRTYRPPYSTPEVCPFHAPLFTSD